MLTINFMAFPTCIVLKSVLFRGSRIKFYLTIFRTRQVTRPKSIMTGEAVLNQDMSLYQVKLGRFQMWPELGLIQLKFVRLKNINHYDIFFKCSHSSLFSTAEQRMVIMYKWWWRDAHLCHAVRDILYHELRSRLIFSIGFPEIFQWI